MLRSHKEELWSGHNKGPVCGLVICCGSVMRPDVVHRGNPNPNRLSDLHGVSARGDGSPLSRLSVADQTAPKARHQKRGNPVRISPFLVRAWGLEPQRRKAREPKGYVTLVKDFQSPPYHEGRTSFQRFKRYSVMTGRIPAKS